MSICARFALSIVFLFAVPASAESVASIPDYSVTVTLSEKATEKLTSSGEWVRIWAYYFGFPNKEEDGNHRGEVSLGEEETDIEGASSVSLGKIDLSVAELRKVKQHAPRLLINVYTSRRVFENNLLHCGIFEDLVEIAARKPIEIHCKLIGE